MITWIIRKSRNGWIFERKEWGAENICTYGQGLLQEYKAAQERKVVSTCYQHQFNNDSRWKPPNEDYLKLNVDGTYSEEGAGFGLVIRNHRGEIEAVLTENIPKYYDADHAETLGFLKALQFTKYFGITHFQLEGAAQCIVNKIKSTAEDLSMTGHIIQGIRNLTLEFPDARISYVGRKQNVPPHEAAQIVLHSYGRNVWFMNFPANVIKAVKSDSS